MPPGWNGWQRSNRAAPRAPPRQKPYLSKATRAYSEQVGENRQDLGSTGESQRL